MNGSFGKSEVKKLQIIEGLVRYEKRGPNLEKSKQLVALARHTSVNQTTSKPTRDRAISLEIEIKSEEI
jgi:hypothetical protein